MKYPAISRLHELFDYCQKTGNLIRKIYMAPNAKVGDIAGAPRKDGRVFINVDGKKYRAHHLVWLWHGKELPKLIDHINRNPSDNRIENLRVADNFQNGWNANLSARNKTGVKGLFWNKQSGKWRVRLMAGLKIIEGGQFNDFELAELVSNELRHKYHGDFANSY